MSKMQESEEFVQFGSPLTCQLCGVESFPPFYACKSTCNLTITNEEKNYVHKTFEKERVECKELRHPCGQQIEVSKIIQHLREIHFMKQINAHLNTSGQGSVGGKDLLGTFRLSLPAEKMKQDQKFRWTTVGFSFKDYQFLFNAEIDPKLGNHGRLMHFWICANGPETDGNKFSYSISISSPSLSHKDKNKFKCNRVVHSCSYYDFDKIRSRRETAPFHVNALVPLLRNEKITNNLQSKVLTVSITFFQKTD